MLADAVASETLFEFDRPPRRRTRFSPGPLFERPYPHLIFENFFADDVYRRLISHWPDIDRYVDLNGARTRKQYTLWDRRVEAGDPERTALWRTVSDAVSAPRIEAALRERLDQRV